MCFLIISYDFLLLMENLYRLSKKRKILNIRQLNFSICMKLLVNLRP